MPNKARIIAASLAAAAGIGGVAGVASRDSGERLTQTTSADQETGPAQLTDQQKRLAEETTRLALDTTPSVPEAPATTLPIIAEAPKVTTVNTPPSTKVTVAPSPVTTSTSAPKIEVAVAPNEKISAESAQKAANEQMERYRAGEQINKLVVRGENARFRDIATNQDYECKNLMLDPATADKQFPTLEGSIAIGQSGDRLIAFHPDRYQYLGSNKGPDYKELTERTVLHPNNTIYGLPVDSGGQAPENPDDFLCIPVQPAA